MSGVLDRLAEIRIIPVVTIDDAGIASDIAAALADAGIGCAEITLRTAQGIGSIAAVEGMQDFIVGAGTVLTPEQVDECADAGARFIVSPGFDDDVVARAQARDLAVLPGVATGTEIQRALRAGIAVVKFFPADRLGGLPTIASLAAPFTMMRFVPSGGVGPTNAREYLDHPAIHSISGSWMVPREAIASGNVELIGRLAREAVALVAQ